MIFYLGASKAVWLERTDVPLMVSRRRVLDRRRILPRARGPWALDSGSFTEIAMYGSWNAVTPRAYAADVARFRDEVGNLAWAAPQDLMCEPAMIARTGATIGEHIALTVDNFVALRAMLGGIVIPVVQGWTIADYLGCVARYEREGVDLRAEPIVGVGSICRRQDTEEAAHILTKLAGLGLRLHAFGLKLGGLRLAAGVLASSDSMAWSYRARRSTAIAGHTHRTCSNCLPFALTWRAKILAALERPQQTRWEAIAV